MWLGWERGAAARGARMRQRPGARGSRSQLRRRGRCGGAGSAACGQGCAACEAAAASEAAAGGGGGFGRRGNAASQKKTARTTPAASAQRPVPSDQILRVERVALRVRERQARFQRWIHPSWETGGSEHGLRGARAPADRRGARHVASSSRGERSEASEGRAAAAGGGYPLRGGLAPISAPPRDGRGRAKVCRQSTREVRRRVAAGAPGRVASLGSARAHRLRARRERASALSLPRSGTTRTRSARQARRCCVRRAAAGDARVRRGWPAAKLGNSRALTARRTGARHGTRTPANEEAWASILLGQRRGLACVPPARRGARGPTS